VRARLGANERAHTVDEVFDPDTHRHVDSPPGERSTGEVEDRR
jgi:hypothetical protein